MKIICSNPIALLLLIAFASSRCTDKSSASSTATERIKPDHVSDRVKHDSDDPAIWINPNDASKSLIVGTDKGGDTGDGALYVFDIYGKEIKDKTVRGLRRPNNVDIAYGFDLAGIKIDIAVVAERNADTLRVFQVPEMVPIDGGGIPVFETDSIRSPMGVALYTAPGGDIDVILSRKSGPSGEYLWQYRLRANDGVVNATLLRKFGNFSGLGEIESVAVDNENGYVYCSDEGFGIRKYYASADSSGIELATFGRNIFKEDHEGISIYKTGPATGYILVSDQQANQFHVFPREGANGPHDHPLIKTLPLSTVESDGSDVTSVSLPGYPAGLFVAMSDDGTFQFYDWSKFGLPSTDSVAIK